MFAGALLAMSAVILGAFGAHALAAHLSPKMLQVFKTGVEYQMVHALALIALGIWSQQNPQKSVNACGWAFVAGIFFFSGSLYFLSVTGVGVFGALTPLGGVSFIAGWLIFAVKGR